MTPEIAQFYRDNGTAVEANPLHNPHGTIFGLMDEVYGPGTAQALQYTSGPFEMYGCHGWQSLDAPSWQASVAYRLKPQSPKPREWWIVQKGFTAALYTSHITAQSVAKGYGGEIIHVREVIK